MEKCALCKSAINLSQPDKSTEDLNALVGSLMERLGSAKIRRDSLPNHGDFWTTGNGLFFIPHLQRGSDHWISHDARGSSWWNPFVRESNNVSLSDDQDLDNGRNGGEILQSRPGAWFARWQDIHRIQSTSRGVRIDLLHQTDLFIKPQFQVVELKTRWQSLSSRRVLTSAK